MMSVLKFALLSATAVALLSGGWYLGRQELAHAAALENVASRDELNELRAQLKQQQRELRGTREQVALQRQDVRIAVPVAGQVEEGEQPQDDAQAEQAARRAEPADLTPEAEDRFFDTYFGDLGAELEAQGSDAARTGEITAAARQVVADNRLGQLHEAACSRDICRVEIKGVTDEVRPHFTAIFMSRMAGHFGAGSVHAPPGSDRMIGYFSRVDEVLPEPLVPLAQQTRDAE